MRKLCASFLCFLLGLALLIPAPPSARAAGREKTPWTVAVYLCGTDLESGDGSASDDLCEMLLAGFDDEVVNLYVMTGGTRSWQAASDKTWIRSNKIKGYIQPKNKRTEVFQISGSEHSMSRAWDYDGKNLKLNNEETLTTFLKDVIDQSPTEHMMVILWDHGGGPLGGAEMDEYTQNTMPLKDIASAMQSANAYRQSKLGTPAVFDIIGFDCCLMGNLEIAYALRGQADYLIASEETEWGYGWNYSDSLSVFTKDNLNSGKLTGVQIGKTIIDAYSHEGMFGSSWNWNSLSELSLALYDLEPAKVEALSAAVDRMGSELSAAMGNKKSTYAAALRAIQSAHTMGGGGYGLVDIYSLARAVQESGSDSLKTAAGAVLECLGTNDASRNLLDKTAKKGVILYRGATGDLSDCIGMSIYYPSAQSYNEGYTGYYDDYEEDDYGDFDFSDFDFSDFDFEDFDFEDFDFSDFDFSDFGFSDFDFDDYDFDEYDDEDDEYDWFDFDSSLEDLFSLFKGRGGGYEDYDYADFFNYGGYLELDFAQDFSGYSGALPRSGGDKAAGFAFRGDIKGALDEERKVVWAQVTAEPGGDVQDALDSLADMESLVVYYMPQDDGTTALFEMAELPVRADWENNRFESSFDYTLPSINGEFFTYEAEPRRTGDDTVYYVPVVLNDEQQTFTWLTTRIEDEKLIVDSALELLPSPRGELPGRRYVPGEGFTFHTLLRFRPEGSSEYTYVMSENEVVLANSVGTDTAMRYYAELEQSWVPTGDFDVIFRGYDLNYAAHESEPVEIVLHSDEALAAAAWAEENGVLEEPVELNDFCTRAQMLELLWRAAGSPDAAGTASFEDVGEDARAAAWAREQGVAFGAGGGRFAPEARLSRAQALTFLYRWANADGAQDAEPYYDAAVRWSAEAGLSEDAGFAPDDACTVGDVLVLLQRCMKSA